MRSLVEWVVALSLFAAVVWLALPVVRSMMPLPSGTVTLVESELPALPGGVPPGAESVPFIMLDGPLVFRVGMSEAEVRSRPFGRLAAGEAASEAGVFGERLVLPLRSGPSRFWVVLERTGPNRVREVTAIYVR